MNNNYSEKIFEAIDTIITQRLNEVSFDKTETCKIVEQNKSNPLKYWVTNEMGLKYEAHSTEGVKPYEKNDIVHVIVPQGNYELKKIIIGKYSENEDNKKKYIKPFDSLVVERTIKMIKDDEDVMVIQTNNNNPIDPKTKEINPIKYTTKRPLDYIGLEFAFNNNIDGFSGEYAIKISLWENDEKELTDESNNILVVSSKNLYGNPYKTTSNLLFQHLFPWPVDKNGEKIDIKKITKIKIQLMQRGGFEIEGQEIKLVKADLKFGYNKNYIEEGLDLILEDNNSLIYNAEDEDKRNLYLDWRYHAPSGQLYNFNINNLPETTNFNAYTFYLLHYEDGIGNYEKNLPEEYVWNWRIINRFENTISNYEITLFTNLATDQYKVLVEYKDNENNTSYIESNSIVFMNENVAPISSASNGSEDKLRLSLEEGDTGIYNIYGLDGTAIQNNWTRKNHIITATFLDSMPEDSELIKSVNWIFPKESTMIVEIEDNKFPMPEDKKFSATFGIKDVYLPGAMNNKIECEVIFITGEKRKGSFVLQFGEAQTSGSTYALNIDFVNNKNCLYYNVPDDTLEVQVTFSKITGEKVEIPREGIKWSWVQDEGLIEEQWIIEGKYLTIENKNSSDNEKVKIKLVKNTDILSQKNICPILQATISNYPIENGLTTHLTAYLSIPIASSKTYQYISGPTRIVYGVDNKNYSISKEPYYLYSVQDDGTSKQVEEIMWEVTRDNTPGLPILDGDIYDPELTRPGGEGIGYQSGCVLRPVSYYGSKNLPLINIRAYTLNGFCVWSQPILILSNRWLSDSINEWNESVDIGEGNRGSIKAPFFVAGKKVNNGLSGVVIGDLTTTLFNTNEQVTGIYGFNSGIRRFSFNDKGDAFIGTNDYNIDFTDGNLKIKAKEFELVTEYLDISSVKQVINIYSKEENTKNFRVRLGHIKEDIYGFDIYDGSFRMYGSKINNLDQLNELTPTLYFAKPETLINQNEKNQYTMYLNGLLQRTARLDGVLSQPGNLTYNNLDITNTVETILGEQELGIVVSSENYYDEEDYMSGITIKSNFQINEYNDTMETKTYLGILKGEKSASFTTSAKYKIPPPLVLLTQGEQNVRQFIGTSSKTTGESYNSTVIFSSLDEKLQLNTWGSPISSGDIPYGTTTVLRVISQRNLGEVYRYVEIIGDLRVTGDISYTGSLIDLSN